MPIFSHALMLSTTTVEKCNHLEFSRRLENARNIFIDFDYSARKAGAVDSLGNFRISMNGATVSSLLTVSTSMNMKI